MRLDGPPAEALGETLAEDPSPVPTGGELAMPPPGGRLERGASLGRYVVLERIGEGAMGVVYAAYDPDLDRKLAIKLLLGARAGGVEDSAGRARLVREAQAMARLTHPNVVTVHDVGTFEGQVFVAMEFVEGSTLGAWLEAATRSTQEVLHVFVQAGAGLEAAHAKGVVHRDFKPDNVLIGADGRARVGDFGIAQQGTAEGRGAGLLGSGGISTEQLQILLETGQLRDVDSSGQLTQAGARIGTPAYMAPEQHLGQPVDARADQFAFCVALWEALFCERPFAGDTPLALGYAVCNGKRRAPPADAPVPRHVQRALERGLSADPAARFEGMRALLDALEPPPRRVGRWWGLGATAVLVAGAGAWAAQRVDPMQACVAAGEHSTPWTSDRAVALRRSFEATEHAAAGQIANKVVDALDDYGRRWDEAWSEACVATHRHGTQTANTLHLRQACLQRRRDAMGALVELLVEAESVDQDVVLASIEGVASLPGFDHCADPEALLADLPPPTDPAVAAAARRVRAGLDDVEARVIAGRVHDAHAMAQALVAEAAEVDDLPLKAEARFALGRAAAAASKLEEGRRELEAAAQQALELRHDRLLGRVANELVAVVGERQSNYEAGLTWARVAAGLADRWPGSEHEAEYRRTACFTVADTGRVEDALDDCRRAVVLAGELYGEDHPKTASSLRAQGKALMIAGRHEESLALFERAYDISERAFGAGHPKTITALDGVAVGRYFAGEVEAARDAMAKVVESFERSLGTGHEKSCINRNNLAAVELELGHLDASAALATRSRDLLIEAFGAEGHAGIAASMSILGEVAEARGDLEAARGHFEASLRVYAATRGGDDHPDTVSSATALGAVLIELGRPVEAVEALERALAGALRIDPAHARVLRSQILLARALRAAGKKQRARELVISIGGVGEGAGTPSDIALRDEALTAELEGLRSELGIDAR